jgi:translin
LSEKEPVGKSDLEGIINSIVRHLDEQYDLRELTLTLSRDAIRLCGQAIKLIHNLDFDNAAKKIEEVKSKLDEIDEKIVKYPEFREKGFISSAFQEYTEARILLSLLKDNEFISCEDLGVPCVPYLLGLGDLIGELRRHILDSIRREEVERAEKLLDIMEEVYIQLVAIDYPDALISGLRHKCDVARSLVEKTRGDITLALQNKQLIKKVQDLSELLGGKDNET